MYRSARCGRYPRCFVRRVEIEQGDEVMRGNKGFCVLEKLPPFRQRLPFPMTRIVNHGRLVRNGVVKSGYAAAHWVYPP